MSHLPVRLAISYVNDYDIICLCNLLFHCFTYLYLSALAVSLTIILE